MVGQRHEDVPQDGGVTAKGEPALLSSMAAPGHVHSNQKIDRHIEIPLQS